MAHRDYLAYRYENFTENYYKFGGLKISKAKFLLHRVNEHYALSCLDALQQCRVVSETQ